MWAARKQRLSCGCWRVMFLKSQAGTGTALVILVVVLVALLLDVKRLTGPR